MINRTFINVLFKKNLTFETNRQSNSFQLKLIQLQKVVCFGLMFNNMFPQKLCIDVVFVFILNKDYT